MGLLDDKVAVVTGGGAGIGRAVALAFAREGARVVVNDLGASRDGTGSTEQSADRVVQEIEAMGGQALASHDSVSDPDGASQIIELATSGLGGLDILVNNAGILRDKTLLKMELGDFDAVIDVHLRGTFLCLQAGARAMKLGGKGGSIINTTSVSGLIGNFGQSNYSAAKAGIFGLTRTASIELQRYGIRVNAVAPVAKTRMTADLPMFHKIAESLSPEHVAPVHVFLASDLSRGVSGTVLSVAGARLSAYKVQESAGKFKDSDQGVWTPQEIQENFESITKI